MYIIYIYKNKLKQFVYMINQILQYDRTNQKNKIKTNKKRISEKKMEKVKKPYGNHLDVDDGSRNGLEPTSGYVEELDPSPSRRSAGDHRWPICCCE